MLAIIITIVTIFSVGSIGLVAFLLINYTDKKYKDFVVKNSVALQSIKDINARYTFYNCINYNQSNVYDNKIYYDSISCSDYLIYQLQFIQKDVCEQIKLSEYNCQNYTNYLCELNNLKVRGQFLLPTSTLSLERLKNIEENFIKKQTLKSPLTQFTITITLYCSQINGRIYAQKNQTFSSKEILALIKKINNRKGKYFVDHEIWSAICRVERGKVTNKIRFAIYKRDGYRCRICGASGNFEQLEIDHIIPIAKGGKTTYNNLQTLCHRCNVQKGDKIY